MQKYNFIEYLSRYMDDVEDMELFKVLKDLPKFIDGKMWIAGGAIRRTLINSSLDSDFDLFFKDESTLVAYKKLLKDIKAIKTAENNHCITYSITVAKKPRIIQLIKMGYYLDAASVIDTFDFTITQFCYDGEYLYCGEYSLWDLARKKLALHKLTFGVATMRRMIKYTNQGFTACAGTMRSILEAVVENPSVVQSDVQYVD